MSKQYYHICNPTTPEPSGCKNIISKKALQEIKDDSNAVYLLHIHLNWEGNKLSSNYGFDIANLIRTKKKSKAPIVFYSPIQQAYFEKKSEKEIKYKILFGRGSAFIEAPFKEATLNKLAEKIEPLNNAALYDVVTMLCNLKGIVIDKLNHDLKFGTDIDKVVTTLAPYLSSAQKQLIQLDEYVTRLKEANNPELFRDSKVQFIDLCTLRLTDEGENEQQVKKIRYKILVVDDVQTELDKAKEYLKSNFIIQTTKSSEEAITILKNDLNNDIVAVISDWRLFTNTKQDYWQPLQGYEILDYAAKNGIRGLFALTSQADFLVHHIRNSMGIRFTLFKKENLDTEKEWNVFSDILYDTCNDINETIISLPGSQQWVSNKRKEKEFDFSFKDLYSQLRHINDDSLLKIDKRADEVWEAFIENKENKNTRYQFGELSTTNISMEVLLETLYQRRIWLALYLNGCTLEKIYEKMSYNKNKTASSTDINQLKSKLCLTENDIRLQKILPEEKTWLKKYALL